MPVACFYNFSEFPFTGQWNGETQEFEPKSKTFMPAFLAQHFAKHLVNRELTRMGLDHATSPKAPEDQPEFAKLFRIAYIRERTLPGGKRNTLADLINAVDKNFKQVKEELPPSPTVNTLGDDAQPLAPRETSENEDPTFTREGGWESGEGKGAPQSAAQSDKAQIVVPPDFNDDDDDYTGVPAGTSQQAPGPDTTAPTGTITTA